MSFYSDMAATALELLAEFGTSITLKRSTGSSIDPTTGATTAGTDTSVITTGMLKKYPDSMIDGTRIQSGDKELILSSEQVPTTTDKPLIDGENWTVVKIDTVSPAGIPLVYFCQVRR